MGDTNPGSSAVDALLVEHFDYGLIKLDLSKPLSMDGNGTSEGPASNPTSDTPLLPYQKTIIAHAVFCALGFLFFLPAGALLARYMRTFVPGPIWFRTHAVLQFAIGENVLYHNLCS